MSKISVIMPVYNVEKYIEASIKSVLAQDFEDFELVIILDGSTDGSGNIVNRYARLDNRIKVFSKANGGISSARNMGLDVMKGEYVYFIDSDDYIAQNTLSILNRAIVETGADIATAQFTWINEDESRYNIIAKDGPSFTVDTDSALEFSLYENRTNLYAWNKLIRKETFGAIRFPEEMIFEDTATTYKVLARAKKVTICDAPLYFYVKRRGSISNSSFDNNRMHHLFFAKEIHSFIAGNHNTVMASANYYLFMAAFFIYVKILDENLVNKYRAEYMECRAIVSKYSRGVSKDQKSRADIKRFALLASYSIGVLSALIRSKRYIKNELRKVNKIYSKVKREARLLSSSHPVNLTVNKHV